MEIFINSVRQEPCLWNPLDEEYRDMVAKDAAWQRVLVNCNSRTITDVHTAKLEWKKLRDNHRDALKRAKLGKNKLLPAHITTWKYAKIMQFLEPHMKYRITENIEDPPLLGPITAASNKMSSSNPEQDVSTSDSRKSPDCPPNKRRRIELAMSPSTIRQDTHTDALESFFNCILKSTRVMPSWMQTQVKKKIFAVIIDAEEKLSTVNHEYNNYCNSNALNVNYEGIENKVKMEVYTEDSNSDCY